MNIYISSGIGIGRTKLAAFDSALNGAGIANYNLIKLSSVIPPKSRVREVTRDTIGHKLPGKWGDRLYVVMAEVRVDTPNTEAWAGIGWVQDKATGRGLFVEHEGNSERTVKDDITQSLKELMKTRGVEFGPIFMNVIGCTCKNKPVCSLVCAVYQSSDWDNRTHLSK